MTKRRFVVLDRDGTIIVERHYLSDPEQVELIPGVGRGLQELRELGLGVVLITNQSAIGRGFFDWLRLDLVHRRLHELFHAENVRLDGIYVCPHRPEDNCFCRKPKTGLLELAASELGFDPKTTFVIGDKTCDIEMGQRVGATTFLVLTGYGSQVASEHTSNPDYIVANVWDAAQIIRRLLATGEGGTAHEVGHKSSS